MKLSFKENITLPRLLAWYRFSSTGSTFPAWLSLKQWFNETEYFHSQMCFIINYKGGKQIQEDCGSLLWGETTLTTARENSVCYWFSNTEKYFWFFWTVEQWFIIFVCYYKGKKPNISTFNEKQSLLRSAKWEWMPSPI